MSARLGVALLLMAGGWLLLLAHPALYSRLGAYALVAVTAFGAWGAAVWRFRDRAALLPRSVGVALGALAATAALSVAINEGASWSGVWRPAVQWALLIVGAWLAVETRALRWLGAGLLAGGVVAGVYALVQYYRLDPLPAVTPFADERIVAFFENPNFLGNFAAGALPLALVAFVRAQAFSVRTGLALATCAVYAGMLLAASRGGWLAGLAGALVVVLGLGRSVWGGRLRVSGSWLAGLVGLLAATTWALSQRPVLATHGAPVTMAERALSTRHIIEPYVESEAPEEAPSATGDAPPAPQIEVRDFTVNHRYFIWEVTWDMIRARPVVGQGYGTYQQRFAAFRDARREEAHFQSLVWTQQQEDTPYAHNEYLHLWAESGLLGLVAFLALVSWIVCGALRWAWREGEGYAWAGLGIVAVMLVHSLVSYPLRLPLNGMIFWLTLGILVGLVKIEDSK